MQLNRLAIVLWIAFLLLSGGVLGIAFTATPAAAPVTQTPATLPYESPKSAPLTIPPQAIYWDITAASLEAAQFYRWAIYVDGVRELLPEATCGTPEGQTPATAWTCTAPVKPAWAGKTLEVVFYLELTAMDGALVRVTR